MTISEWIKQSSEQLRGASISSARLDAELLLSHVLHQSRAWLIAHQNDNIDDAKMLENATKLLAKRLQRVPIAYLTNHKEFYNRSFYVDESVLIPRPESEMIIEVLKTLVKPTVHKRLLDIGTGSGALGITAKLEMPELSVTISDISAAALQVARKNAHALGAKPIRYVQSDLLSHWLSHDNPQKFDVIIANLPYVNPVWEQSPETVHEPSLALYAEDNGMKLIKICVQKASSITSVSGYLLLEADPEQHKDIVTTASASGFQLLRIDDYIVTLQKNNN
ncbi:MAG: peptide chain release factor N(5)-glutamine methyltransferase [Candidatus Saccharimonadales bacterium]